MKRMEMFEFMKSLAAEAGKMALEGRRSLRTEGIYSKATDIDLVTDVDRQVEAFVDGSIRNRYPDHGIYGEESGIVNPDSPWRWVIDPIDGTVSFIHDTHYYCVSIALEYQGEPVMGAVYAPRLDELYAAERGKGATLNGEPIHVSGCTRLRSALFSSGFACVRAGAEHDNLEEFFPKITRSVQGIRRCGSAALDLCQLAAGRYDGYWEMGLAPYDCAAGVLIVREAGGRVTDFHGGGNIPDGGIAATNGLLHDELLKFLH